MAILDATFNNGSNMDWTLDYHGTVYEIGLSNQTKKPGPLLQAHNGFEETAIDQIGSTIDFGPLEVFCCWRNSAGYRFGVRLHVGLHIGPAGYAPIWYVMSDYGKPAGSQPDWVLSAGSVNDPQPGQPYVWNNIPGVKITARPDAQHAKLTVPIIIQGVK
ncbi:MAG: hypothetical protein ACX93I_06795 [Winogradskyella sp.]